MDVSPNERRRADRANAQTIDRLDPDACLRIGECPQFGHTARLTCFGLAQLDAGTVAPFGAEIMVKCDDAMNLGACQVQIGSNRPYRIFVDAAEGRLNVMQDRQQRSFARTVAIKNYGQCVIRVHNLVVRILIGFVK